MPIRLPNLWNTTRSSLWFLPTLLTAAAALAAVGLIWLDEVLGTGDVGRWLLIFGVGGEGARVVLSTVAATVATVAATTFAVTIVALSISAQQYSPRVLRNFIRDTGNQMVLGILIGTFVYSLLVLQSVRTGDEEFVPSLALVGALVLALVSLGAFIYFISHIANAIQGTTITAGILRETTRAVDRLFPGDGEGESDDGDDVPDDIREGMPVPSHETEYVQVIEIGKLLELASKRGLVIEVQRSAGDFVAEGETLAVVGLRGRADGEAVERVQAQFKIGSQRTPQQDVQLGVRQLVDMAIKALSPGINDPTTAINCIDHLGAILRVIAARKMPPRCRYDDGGCVRVIMPPATFVEFLKLSFNQIRIAGETHAVILVRLLCVIEALAKVAQHPDRRRLLLEHANDIGRAADRGVVAELDRAEINEQLCRVGSLLRDVGRVETITVRLR